jgi:glycosyltransferase involved in cell wall biosynthesis
MNPRMVKDADALTAAGYTVSVIAPDFSAWGRKADAAFADRAWTVVESPQFGPLAKRTVRFCELIRRLWATTAVERLGLNAPSLIHAAIHPATPLLIRAAKRHKARLYLSHLLAALPAAAIAARLHGVRYSFDAEDFHPGDLADTPENAATNRLVRLIEARYLPGCDYVTAASPCIADAYAQAYGINRPEVILNTFPLRRAFLNFTLQGSHRPGPSLYWISQTIGAGRGLECAVSAIARAKSRPHLYLRGTPDPTYIQSLLTFASECGVLERVHILEKADSEEMERLASCFDIGLSAEPGSSPNNRLALGNKIFTYLLAGIPIVLSNTEAHVDFSPLLGKAAQVFAADDAEVLAKALDRWLLNPISLAAAREHAWRLGQERFNWEVESQKLVELVGRVLPPQSGPRSRSL